MLLVKVWVKEKVLRPWILVESIGDGHLAERSENYIGRWAVALAGGVTLLGSGSVSGIWTPTANFYGCRNHTIRPVSDDYF